MNGMWVNNIKISIFKESHGEGIGINIDNLPSRFYLDMEEILKEMKRRAQEKIIFLHQENRKMYQKYLVDILKEVTIHILYKEQYLL